MALNVTNWFSYPTNYSNGTAVSGVGTWMQYTNSIVGDGLGIGIIILIWLMSFGLSMMMGVKKAILASSFITFVFAVYLYMLNMLNVVVIFILIVLMVIGAIGAKEEGGL